MPQTNRIKVSKLYAVKKQLESAIFLYFNDEDPISIHTLACAAHEVLRAFIYKKTNDTMYIDRTHIIESKRKLFCNKINHAKNFFKHADNDPDEIIEFNPELSNFLIFDACEKYMQYCNEKPIHFIIFRAWFSHMYPQIIKFKEVKDNNKFFFDLFSENKLDFFQKSFQVLQY